jgi:hypothetical protein
MEKTIWKSETRAFKWFMVCLMKFLQEHYENLGNTILVKLELWELVIVFNKNFYSATNLCLRYASAKCGR